MGAALLPIRMVDLPVGINTGNAPLLGIILGESQYFGNIQNTIRQSDIVRGNSSDIITVLIETSVVRPHCFSV